MPWQSEDSKKMKKVLMIAYAFPPQNASGIARPFYFAKYLRDFGYAPTVITRSINFKGNLDFDLLAELDQCCDILRTQPWDCDDWPAWNQRCFGLFDWFFRTLGLGRHAVSDRFIWGYRYLWPNLRENVHWVWPALLCGFRAFHQQRFDLIWATGDPWSSLYAGYWLSRLTGKPLVADIRDPWTYGVLWNPYDQAEASRARCWERRIINKAVRIVYTSPLTTHIMKQKVSKASARKMTTITNGFSMEQQYQSEKETPSHKCVFCYVGKLSKNFRNADILLRGFKQACQDPELARDVHLQFIGGMDNFDMEVAQYGLGDLVQSTGYVSHSESKRFMRGSDVLVLLQTITGPGIDVISGKGFEYLSARKPVLAVVPDSGGDAWLIRQHNAGIITGVQDSNRIAHGIRHYWELWKQNKLTSKVSQFNINHFERRHLTKNLAALFDEVLDEPKSGFACSSNTD